VAKAAWTSSRLHRHLKKWLEQQVPLVRQDLQLKHASMAEAAFPFFRGHLLSLAPLWQDVCKDIADAPKSSESGFTHSENFGTWRDVEGRYLGVNDLDEAWPAAYTLDLVRVIASAYLAIWEQLSALLAARAAEAIEEGYRDGLAAGGKLCPRRRSSMLRLMALSKLRDPIKLWDKLSHWPKNSHKVPRKY